MSSEPVCSHVIHTKGVDILSDWEYPTDPSTGGSPDDYDNFVGFVSNIRQAFDAQNGGWQITVSLPYEYDSLRGFLLEDLANHVDWFNVQAYDIYDLWDVDVNGNGYVRGHSNISTISNTFDLLQRNGIGPNKTVMGIPFFGTSYTLSDISCTQPGCNFDGPGFPASCTNEFGFMNYGGQYLLSLQHSVTPSCSTHRFLKLLLLPLTVTIIWLYKRNDVLLADT